MLILKNSVMISSFIFLLLSACLPSTTKTNPHKDADMTTIQQSNTDTATFGGGCFWCTEAIYQELKGVLSVSSGYSGGQVKNPTYKEVCSGLTGHAECVQIIYNPAEITYESLLEVFFKTHDPTTLNRQGNDAGTQYRSVIFFHSLNQEQTAKMIIKELTESKAWANPIVTEVSAFTKYYQAEDYHQNYFSENGSQPYCAAIIQPKMEKFRKVFKEKLKDSEK